MRRRTFLLVLSGIVLLTGCFESKRQLVAQCRLDAIKLYPTSEIRHERFIGDYIKVCMQAKGHDFLHGQCRAPTQELDPNCYS